MQEGETRAPLTEVGLRVTRTFPNRPVGAFWAMRKVIVLVSDVLEEVNLVFALEESGRNAVHYGVSPTLSDLSHVSNKAMRSRHSPRSRTLQMRPDGQRTLCMLRFAKSSCRRFQNYSRLNCRDH